MHEYLVVSVDSHVEKLSHVLAQVAFDLGKDLAWQESCHHLLQGDVQMVVVAVMVNTISPDCRNSKIIAIGLVSLLCHFQGILVSDFGVGSQSSQKDVQWTWCIQASIIGRRESRLLALTPMQTLRMSCHQRKQSVVVSHSLLGYGSSTCKLESCCS